MALILAARPPTVEEYMSLVHPEDREFVAETIQKMFAERRGFDFTKRIVRTDGEIRRVRCVGGPARRLPEGAGPERTAHDDLVPKLKRC